MKTMFTMGFASHDLFGIMNPYMGQAEPPMSTDDRNKMLNDLGAAGDKFAAINAWIQAHPNQQADLGSDYQAFRNALDNSSSFSAAAASVSQRLNSDQPANWSISATDYNAASNWVLFVNQVYDIISRHGAAPAGGIPGARPGMPGYVAPGAVGAAGGSAMSPLAIGATAVGVVGLLALLLRS